MTKAQKTQLRQAEEHHDNNKLEQRFVPLPRRISRRSELESRLAEYAQQIGILGSVSV